jgi:hypothetical protein
VDSGEAAAIADLFTVDGVWAAGTGEPCGPRRDPGGLHPRQAVARRQSRHVMTNVPIDDGRNAMGRFTW